jgi:hypothetical protein
VTLTFLEYHFYDNEGKMLKKIYQTAFLTTGGFVDFWALPDGRAFAISFASFLTKDTAAIANADIRPTGNNRLHQPFPHKQTTCPDEVATRLQSGQQDNQTHYSEKRPTMPYTI